MHIYLAGPLFTLAERDSNKSLKDELVKLGHTVYLPQEHETRDLTAKQIFDGDVEGIDTSEVVVANMDGPDPDSGTCWECGYAYGRGIPCIIFRTDFRVADEAIEKAPFNLMLTESSTQIPIIVPFEDIETVARTISIRLGLL